MIRIAVVDDDKKSRDEISGIVHRFFDSVQADYETKTYSRPQELLWDLEGGDEDEDKKQYFDIFFLDIEMDINGLDVARAIRKLYLEPYILFVTSHLQYSTKGYEYNAYRYILKGDMEEKIPEALDFLLNRLQEKMKRYYTIQTSTIMERIAYDDIYYMYLDKQKYTYICTRNGATKVRASLKSVYQALDGKEFIFTDKAHLVNIKNVMSMNNQELSMRDGSSIPVSRPQSKQVKQLLYDYWQGNL